MKLYRAPGLYATILALLGAVTAASARSGSTRSELDDEFSFGDSIKIECAQLGNDGRELLGTDGRAQWTGPTCIETNKPLAVYYGRDGPVQCSVRADEPFHETMLHSVSLDRPLRCRMKRNKLRRGVQFLEFALRVEGALVRSDGRRKMKRVAGNFNAVVHGQNGNLVAASVYPVVDQALPETVAGVCTMQFNLRWYEGAGITVLMANKRHEEEFIIQPVVAVMFCILTACIVYVVGRVYVESSLIPRLLKEKAHRRTDSKGQSEAPELVHESKKTN
ncbi:hypothetical protein GGI07_005287 [Coemansia sp. Benny D115]|nr:hypothetical protein GGI07_005287 [Coemansia sp. Benny D115]